MTGIVRLGLDAIRLDDAESLQAVFIPQKMCYPNPVKINILFALITPMQ